MLHHLLSALNHPAFSFSGTPTTYAELLGFATGLASVFLVARNNILTFPVGIVNAGFFFVLFIDAHLYADAWLQVFFLVVQVAGWIAWAKAGPQRSALKVGRAGRMVLGLTVAALILTAYLLVPVLHAAHGAYPVPDASSTALSVAAQTLMSYRLIQHWYLWIAADLIYIPLYAIKGLYFTSALYVLFLTLCLAGLRHWRRLLVRPGPPEPQSGATQLPAAGALQPGRALG
jgi:nicotinamide mononucleotide transporter